MRLSLRDFLLLPPAFFLGVLIAVWWQSGMLYHYTFTVVHRQTIYAASDLAFAERSQSGETPQAVLDAWLAGRLPANHPFAKEVWGDRPGLDPWGNPYQAARDVRLPDGGVEAIGVYSLGRDGISHTGGNDPDDINSWDINSCDFYVADVRRRERMMNGVHGVVLTPFSWAVLVGLGRLCWGGQDAREESCTPS